MFQDEISPISDISEEAFQIPIHSRKLQGRWTTDLINDPKMTREDATHSTVKRRFGYIRLITETNGNEKERDLLLIIIVIIWKNVSWIPNYWEEWFSCLIVLQCDFLPLLLSPILINSTCPSTCPDEYWHSFAIIFIWPDYISFLNNH